ncbi:MAG: hypothetical protein GC192_17310 [Bacteroidetes bacterium]|nr:hypothetical protein [Bacteroidota bacterium]
MTRMTLEINGEKEMAILKAFLKLLNVKIVKQEKTAPSKATEFAKFYKEINVDLKDYKFNRDEANER